MHLISLLRLILKSLHLISLFSPSSSKTKPNKSKPRERFFFFNLEKKPYQKFRAEGVFFPSKKVVFRLRHLVLFTLVCYLSPWIMQSIRDIRKYLNGWSFTHCLWFLLDPLEIKVQSLRQVLVMTKCKVKENFLGELSTLLLICLYTSSFQKFFYHLFFLLFRTVLSLIGFLDCFAFNSEVLKAFVNNTVLLFHGQKIWPMSPKKMVMSVIRHQQFYPLS